MPRVHKVKKARKAYPEDGIAKGDSYYWWKFRYGGKRRSKTYPRRSQLTQSAFLSAIYDIEEDLGNLAAEDGDDLLAQLEDLASRIRELGEEAQENRENMPQSLQDGEVGQMLEERYEVCEAWADGLESIQVDEDEAGDEPGTALQAAIEEAQGTSYEGP